MSRKLSKPRPRQGEHLAALRKQAKLTQAELARLIGECQPNVAYWELSDKPPRSDVLPKLAKVLGVSVGELLSPDSLPQRQNGPVGKLRKVFDEASALPRRQQDKIIEFVSAFIDQQKRKAG